MVSSHHHHHPYTQRPLLLTSTDFIARVSLRTGFDALLGPESAFGQSGRIGLSFSAARGRRRGNDEERTQVCLLLDRGVAGIGLAVLVGVGDIDIDLRADVGRSSDGGRPMPISNRDFGLWSGGKGRYGGEGMGLEGEMHGYVSEGVCGLGEVLTVENDVDRRVGLGSAVACEVEGEEGGYSWGEGGDREVPGTDLEGRVRGGVEEVGDDDVLEPGLLAGYDGVRIRFASHEIWAVTLTLIFGPVSTPGPNNDSASREGRIPSTVTWSSSSHSGIVQRTCSGSVLHVHRISFNILSDTLPSLSPYSAGSSSPSSSSSSEG